MTEPTKLKTGWYSDEKSSGQVRYWDGAKWSDHRALRTVNAAPIPKRDLKGGGPGEYIGGGVIVAVLAGGALAFAASLDGDEVLFLIGVVLSVISSILVSIGVIGRGVQIGLREHMYDFEGGNPD